MFRSLLTALIVFSFFAADAQFNKGNILAGGSLSYATAKSTSLNFQGDQKSNSANFGLSVGKTFDQNKVFGVNINYQPFSNTYNNGAGLITNKTDYYGIGIFYRQYKNLGKEFYVFGEVALGYQGSNSSTADSSGNKMSTGTGYSIYAGISPGIAYKFSKHFMLEITIPQIFSAAYSSATTKSGSVTTDSNNNFRIGASLSSNPLNSLEIGFRLII